ncbi:DUF4280 domain-containing protein [Flavonifractor sp. An82]|uniref:DUF4280 domain-containing protein n=1 Tax=Flavonifractor sp. An82 TaxID=1965660 RepID=UPI000B3A6BB7|nr:DUF4280 domain-containing protein [Flavonifractor sp. An82]OUN22076.1 hypothetical protein B5G34_08560 [Flavonifractor sp. An82]
MAQPAVQTAVCKCSFGAAPAPLTVTSQMTVAIGGMPAATILDGAGMVNVPTFGMCSNLGNPAVAAATAAAMGALTPAPCVPATVSWMPGCPTVLVCKRPLLNNSSKLMCAYGGVIQVSVTPAQTVKVP